MTTSLEPAGSATFVDTNVLLDLLTAHPTWLAWSQRKLGEASLRGRLLIDGVVYAEASVGYLQGARFDAVLATVQVAVVQTPRAALFAAGKAFRQYRKAGGTRTGVLPNFFIGAHAAVIGLPLLTRDPRRYRTYFPMVRLIRPEDA